MISNHKNLKTNAMTLSESLKRLKPLIGTENEKFEERLKLIKENYNSERYKTNRSIY